MRTFFSILSLLFGFGFFSPAVSSDDQLQSPATEVRDPDCDCMGNRFFVRTAMDLMHKSGARGGSQGAEATH